MKVIVARNVALSQTSTLGRVSQFFSCSTLLDRPDVLVGCNAEEAVAVKEGRRCLFE